MSTNKKVLNEKHRLIHDESTKNILRRQLDGLPSISKSNGTVFAYARPFDICLIIISTLSAIIAGALNPLLTVIYGLLVHSFQDYTNSTVSSSHLSSSVSQFTLYYVYLGIAEFVFVYISTVGFYHTGERITRNLRRAYLKAIIRQNIAFFDTLSAGEVTTRITSDMNVIQEGITSKISLCLTALATFLAAVVISFIEYWKLAFILLSTVVAVGGAEFLGAMFAVKFSRPKSASMGEASSVAEEAISSIRHVSASGIQKAMSQRYLKHLKVAESWGLKTRISISVMIGALNAVPYMSYGLAFWQGSRYIVRGEMSAAAVVTTILAIIIGSFAVGRIAPSAESFISSITHAGTTLKAIARRSPLDPFSVEGQRIEKVCGDIELTNISLVYPSRQDVQVLDSVNIRFPANQTTVLVGATGCGKSSIIRLLERFYEPTGVCITLDGIDISELNLRWLRQQISYVDQEPILFNTSIFENILLGLSKPTVPRSEAEDRDLVYAAAKVANAHDFITALPQGYQTEVGAKGLQLSGGQRQRVCIARAVIRDPKILLLDEATSALDVISERAIQLAMETAANNRTTIVIAHRLSTARNADNIVVMSRGAVIEQGRHEDLLSHGGLYSRLVESQQLVQIAKAVEESQGNDPILQDEEPETSLADDKNEQTNLNETALSTHFDEKSSSSSSRAAPMEIQPSFRVYFQIVANLNREEALLIFTGLVLCIIAGFVIPVQSVFFAESIAAITLPPPSYDKLRHDVNFWSLMFLMIAIVSFIAWMGQGICFSFSTERLTCKARDQAFRSILRQNVGFFDEKQNSSGALTAFLATSGADLAGLSGPVIGACLTFTSTLAAGIVLSLAIGWKLALVCSATIPIMAGCGYVRLKLLALFDGKVRKTHEEAAMYASEIVTAIRPVASLTLEAYVLDEYNRILSTHAAESLRSILKASTLYAASQSFQFFCAALAFWYGGTLLASNEYNILQFYICFAALISGSQVAGTIFSYAPDMSKATHAGRDLKVLFERIPDIDTWSTEGDIIPRSTGRIDINNISFSYPTRPERTVLQHVTVHAQPGQYIALVGASGSGKSTIIQLLERFFDPNNGEILIDGHDISQLAINDYRSLVALVSQEPILYNGSIRENLILGTARVVEDEELNEVCKEANIYEFIASLPDGLSTNIGTAGTMLSGGQKQRLSIARALLRKPQILLLDEATSALDSETEKAVQEALDRAAKQRTTIAVAHRLSTIQHADLICVMDHGRIIEQGTHAELLSKRGMYSELVHMQSLENRKEAE